MALSKILNRYKLNVVAVCVSYIHHDKMGGGDTIPWNAFDTNNLRFGPTQKRGKAGFIPVYYGGNSDAPIRIQTPGLRVPFGVGVYAKDAGTELTSYSIKLSAENEGFLAFMRQLDEHFMNVAESAHPEWNVKAAKYQPLVSEARDPKYAPTVRFKISLDSNKEPRVGVFDSNFKKVSLDDVTRNSFVKVIVRVSSIWLAAQWGISLNIEQILIVSKGHDFANEPMFIMNIDGEDDDGGNGGEGGDFN